MACLLFGFLGYFYASSKKTLYQANVTFMLEDEDESKSLMGFTNIAKSLGVEKSGSNNADKKEVFNELIKSRKISELALMTTAEINGKEDLMVNHYQEILNRLESDGKNQDTLGADYKFTTPYEFGKSSWKDELLTSHATNIALSITSEIRPSGLFDLRMTNINEEFTKKFLDNLITVISDYYVDQQTQRSQATLKMASQRTDSVFSELKMAELRLAHWFDSNKKLTKTEGFLPQIRLKRDVDILNSLYAESIKNLEVAKLSLIDNTPLLQIIDDARLPLLVLKKSKLIYSIAAAMAGFFLSSSIFIVMFFLKDALEKEKAKSPTRQAP